MRKTTSQKEHVICKTLFYRRCVLAVACLMFSVALSASVSNARAQDVTYGIVDYPFNEADEFSGTDTISGTIITDGTIGPLSTANIVGGTFSFTGPFFSLSGSASFGDPVGLRATSTQLVLDPGADSSFSISTSLTQPEDVLTANVEYANYSGGGQYYGSLRASGHDSTILSAYFDSVPVPTEEGSIGANSSWVIAAVPEPASLPLLFSALLVFGLVYLRRRWIHGVYKSREAFVAAIKSVFHTLPENHRISVGPGTGGSIVREHVASARHRTHHFGGFFRSRNTRGCKRSAGGTHGARVLALQPLEVRTLLSVSLPAGWQAVPIENFDLIAAPDFAGSSVPYGLTPNQVRGAYGLGTYTLKALSGGVSFGAINGDGSGQTIAIVDAWNDPYATTDLNNFSNYFGLPTFGGPGNPTFQQRDEYGGLSLPGTDPAGPYSITGNLFDWETEESLDIEWAHVAAPMANIVLFQAQPIFTGYNQGGQPVYDYSTLYTAVQTAANWPGVVAVSMSWSGDEFSGESSDDSYFTTPSGHIGGSATLGGLRIAGGVTFLAAAGDNGPYDPGVPTTIAPQYPAASPNVVAVGGTSLYPSGNAYGTETSWGNGTDSWDPNSGGGGGGGISAFESQPAYQSGVVRAYSTSQRTYPDVSADGNAQTGVPIYDSWDFGSSTPWLLGSIGGTSLATPFWAGTIAIADQGRAIAGLGSLDGPSQTLPLLYKMPAAAINDITTGPSTGPSTLYSPETGYDLTTGLGSPVANVLVPDLDLVAPTVTINVASTQPISTGTPTGIEFDVVFSEPVNGFNDSCVSFSGTALHEKVTSITPVPGGTTYDVFAQVGGNGTIVASIPAGVVEDAVGDLNVASTSNSNPVTVLVTLVSAGGPGPWDSTSADWLLKLNGVGVPQSWWPGSNAQISVDSVLTLATGFDPDALSLAFAGSGPSGGTVDLNGNSVVTVGSLSGNDGEFINNCPDSTSTLTADEASDLTYSGTILDGAAGLGVVALIVSGDYTLTLTGTNSYSGTTIVSAGTTLNIENDSAFGGDTAGAVIVNSSATLQLQGGIDVPAPARGAGLFLAGDGSAGNNGALESVSGANFWAGPVYLCSTSGDTRINSDADTLALTGGILSGSVSGATGVLTIGGAGNVTVSGIGIDSSVSTVNEDGAGTVTLSATDNQSGGTTVYSGTLCASTPSALPAGGSLIVGDGSLFDWGGGGTDASPPVQGFGGGSGGDDSPAPTGPGPTVTSVQFVDTHTAGVIQFNVTFNTAVQGVTAGSFAIHGAGPDAVISSVAGSGQTYLITVTGVTGNICFAGLAIVNGNGITDLSAVPLSTTGTVWSASAQGVAACQNSLQAIATVLDPSCPSNATMQAIGVQMNIESKLLAANGGTLAGVTGRMVDVALLQVLEGTTSVTPTSSDYDNDTANNDPSILYDAITQYLLDNL